VHDRVDRGGGSYVSRLLVWGSLPEKERGYLEEGPGKGKGTDEGGGPGRASGRSRQLGQRHRRHRRQGQ
jgi:hypothetical protein